MSAECNGCGGCCDPVVSAIAPIYLQDGTATQLVGRAEANWMRSHLTPMRRADGLKLVPWMRGGGWTDIQGQRDNVTGKLHLCEPVLLPSFFYRCDLFDTGTRRCSDHANRPNMCRGYPWFGEAPDPTKSVPPTCSYLADVGLPVAEIPVEWRS